MVDLAFVTNSSTLVFDPKEPENISRLFKNWGSHGKSNLPVLTEVVELIPKLQEQRREKWYLDGRDGTI